METVQYISENGGAGGLAILVIAFILFRIAKAAWSGTLSEDAQRRNHKRDKESKE